jgi:hypothetical protein
MTRRQVFASSFPAHPSIGQRPSALIRTTVATPKGDTALVNLLRKAVEVAG